MIEEWKPPIEISDDDISVGSPAAVSSSQDGAAQKRSRIKTDRCPASFSSFGAKGKGKSKREDSPPARGGSKAGASSKRARKSAASDANLDIEMGCQGA